MKLRIKENSLRLRVMRSELERLQAGERIEASIRFGPAADAVLRYSLAIEATAKDPIGVSFHLQEIATRISREQLELWSSEVQVGLYASLPIDSGTTLEVSIEKDFACLDSNGEENADTFANPLSGTVC